MNSCSRNVSIRNIAAASGVALMLAGLLACAANQAEVAHPSYDYKEALALPLDTSDDHILGYLDAVNKSDALKGRLAEQKAVDPRVKDYGRRMAEEHHAMLRLNDRVAESLNLTEAWDHEAIASSDEHRHAVERLQQMNGPAFDRAYIRHVIRTHQEVLRKLGEAARDAEDPGLKEVVEQHRPVIQLHLHEALVLEKELTGGLGTGDEGRAPRASR